MPEDYCYLMVMAGAQNSSDLIQIAYAYSSKCVYERTIKSDGTVIHDWSCISGWRRLDNSSNANDFKRPGKYYFVNGSNLPDANGYVYIDVIVDKNGSDVIQIGYGVISEKIYRRRLSSGSWGSWKSITFS